MIQIVEYNPGEDNLFESSLDKMGFENLKLITCIHPSPQDFKQLSEQLKLPSTTLHQAADDHERPRIYDMDNYTQMIFKSPSKKNEKLRVYSFAVFLSENLLLILSRHDIQGLHELVSLDPEVLKPYFRQGTTNLLYELLEKVMDDYFKYHEDLGNSINYIEDQMVDSSKPKNLHGVFKLKTSLIYFNKALSVNRDVIIALEKGLAKHANPEIIPKFRLVYNDILQLIDVTGTDREIVTGAIEIYMTSVSNSLNISMKKMSAWASLILLPTFITGLYGMNFRFMPEIMWKYGYVWSLGLMVLSVVGLYLIFKKNKYL
ncbi:MAG: magnesium transporter CorA family protein [Nanoarchaeota archaeon]|nr:magnesium transporter CorA family protein [Nanoarchaeota archaeon]